VLEVQRANKAFIKDGLAGLNRVSFRDLPDKEGDSATFLSFFLSTEDEARQAAKDLAAAGVDGCFYWYDNNWHYHRSWNHLKQMKSPAALAPDRLGYGENWAERDLSTSDAIMGRTVCMLIKLSWDEPALAERLQKMQSVLA
jgi:8-amino-3,8-dideoxy-alpha-D-manno-octulosonate transaminase